MRNKYFSAVLLLSLLIASLPSSPMAQTPTPTPTDWKPTAKTGAGNTTSPVYLYGDNAILIASYFDGVFRSLDKGKTWTACALPKFSTHNILRVSSTLIAATGDGFYRSTDNGATWTLSNGGLSQWFGSGRAYSLTLMNGAIYAGAAEFAGSPRCFVSRDGGLNWARADAGLEAAKNGYSIANLNGVLVYADRDGKLYRSINGGTSWTETSTGYELDTKPTLVTSHRHFFVAHAKGIFRSDNYGQSWTKIFTKPVVAQAAAAPSSNIVVRGRTLMVISTTGSSLPPTHDIYVSKDYGQTWQQSFAPYAQDNDTISSFYAIAFANDRAYMLSKQSCFENTKILPPALGVASAASYKANTVAADSINALFAGGLATATTLARTIPLPTTLNGSRIKLWDSTGAESYAPLFYVSATQANFLVPANTPSGTVIVTAELNNAVVAEGQITVTALSPGLFTADASGTGYPAGYFIRVRNGAQTDEAAVTYDTMLKKFVARPLDLGPDTDQVFLVLFGTGLRARSALSNVTATINGLTAEVLFAGAQGTLVGLDQINLRVPRALKGINRDAEVIINVSGNAANTIKISVK